MFEKFHHQLVDRLFAGVGGVSDLNEEPLDLVALAGQAPSRRLDRHSPDLISGCTSSEWYTPYTGPSFHEQSSS